MRNNVKVDDMDFTEAHIPACSSIGIACRLGNSDAVRRLIAGGAPLDVQDNRGWYPLHEAAQGLHEECCQLILATEKGREQLNRPAHDGLTPLLLVCRRDKQRRSVTQIAQILLDNGADVNKASLDEMTPLIQAIRSRNRQLIDLLLDCGADRRATWYKQWSALHETAAKKDERTMRRLIGDGVDIFAVDSDSQTALYVACQEGYLPTVKILLEAAGDRADHLANIRAESGASCVYAAASEGFTNCLEALIAAGAYCNYTMDPVWAGPDAQGGVHPLAAAAQKNFAQCVKMLLPQLDREILERTEVDPLAVAAAHGATEVVQILLAESDLPIDRLTEAPQNHLFIAFLRPIFQRRYYTALREAVRKGHLEVVRLLGKAGAQMTYPTEIYSPFLFSFRNRIPMEILECFLANNVQLNLICGGSLCHVPDAVLATLGSENRKQLLALLRCGLKPSLMEWCTCRNPSGYSLLEEVRHLSYVGNVQELLHILAVFSPAVPSCCDAVAKCLNVPSQRVFRLEHLCRCAIRQYTPPSKLLDDSWMTEIGLPKKIISFVRCDPVPSGLSDLMALNDNGVE